MDTKRRGRMRYAFLVSRVSFLDVEFFELFECFVQHYVAVEHVFNNGFEAGAYLHRSSDPWNRYARLRRALKISPGHRTLTQHAGGVRTDVQSGSPVSNSYASR